MDEHGVRHSIRIPEIAVEQALDAGCPLDAACVLLMKETSGGKNVWGADKTPVPDSQLPYHKGGDVTERNYTAYKAARSRIGNQGVGPVQLTWPAFQDRADELGGCWKPEVNCFVGFEVFAKSFRSGGYWNAFRAYNGKASYADDAMARLPKWQEVIRNGTS